MTEWAEEERARNQSDGGAYRVPVEASTQEDTTCPHPHWENHSTSSEAAESTFPAVEVLPNGTEVALRVEFGDADASNQSTSQLYAQNEYNARTRRALLMLRPDFDSRQNTERPTVAALVCALRTCFENVARDNKHEDILSWFRVYIKLTNSKIFIHQDLNILKLCEAMVLYCDPIAWSNITFYILLILHRQLKHHAPAQKLQISDVLISFCIAHCTLMNQYSTLHTVLILVLYIWTHCTRIVSTGRVSVLYCTCLCLVLQ